MREIYLIQLEAGFKDKEAKLHTTPLHPHISNRAGLSLLPVRVLAVAAIAAFIYVVGALTV